MQNLRPVSSLASFQRRKGEVDTLVRCHSAASQKKNQWHCACGVKETRRARVVAFPAVSSPSIPRRSTVQQQEFHIWGRRRAERIPQTRAGTQAARFLKRRFLLQDSCTSCTILKAEMSKVLPVMDVDVKDHDQRALDVRSLGVVQTQHRTCVQRHLHDF
ncbi:unnamed protein product [Musa textilis]